ncbi:hypothetical protein CP973_39040 [Streptomyces albofaciens JCM 4342]|uniref:hypothetical protein n=1 Tax=Streptomyces albofaciens TaxID=66866 RepID=UPI000A6FD2AB|nr:hypothetical protein [Streptomyces albofaciens]KAA6215005.1 hypothetical protein CP973_39040 [Streptomyces albofaciens JCM 4342]
MDKTPHPAPLRDTVIAGSGGAMTVEVGVITGELTIATTDLRDGTARVTVQYSGANEWYELEGSPARIPTTGIHNLHDAVLAAIRAGGAAQTP